jgi:hypothetical protein
VNDVDPNEAPRGLTAFAVPDAKYFNCGHFCALRHCKSSGACWNLCAAEKRRDGRNVFFLMGWDYAR